ncbi:hypothetical protein [Anaerorhabdus furcosa]|uniref:Uncharacterized protein n=1 Tax=Anaerorhabdus furcosa TaxID=118967 RepID=A0A1T4PDY7_9FIRM|nr:hypothetical protein [Anaerorhabdus furcosa]SJZ89722.1 hypothetical protein SAMN02745191_1970 [Anaerorhabdus furcosa]
MMGEYGEASLKNNISSLFWLNILCPLGCLVWWSVDTYFLGIGIFIILIIYLIYLYSFLYGSLSICRKTVYNTNINEDATITLSKNNVQYNVSSITSVRILVGRNDLIIEGEIFYTNKLKKIKRIKQLSSYIIQPELNLFLKKLELSKKIIASKKYVNNALEIILESAAKNREEYFVKEMQDTLILVPAYISKVKSIYNLENINDEIFVVPYINDGNIYLFTRVDETKSFNELNKYIFFPTTTRNLLNSINSIANTDAIFNERIEKVVINERSSSFKMSLEEYCKIFDNSLGGWNDDFGN